MHESRPLVLIVEDDQRLSLINRRALESVGYDVKTAYTLEQARSMLACTAPCVILLDVKLPDGSGFALCREIRKTSTAYIIFLTSVTEAAGELEGLACGGDDYLRKPYGIALLRERVKKGLRQREAQIAAQEWQLGALRLDIVGAQAYIGGQNLLLSPKEFALLLFLARQEGNTASPEQIYETLWSQPTVDNKNPLQMLVSRLRKKLLPYGFDIYVQRGHGYYLETR